MQAPGRAAIQLVQAGILRGHAEEVWFPGAERPVCRRGLWGPGLHLCGYTPAGGAAPARSAYPQAKPGGAPHPGAASAAAPQGDPGHHHGRSGGHPGALWPLLQPGTWG